MNRQSKINLLVVAGALCLLCLAVIPSETTRTKALQRRYSLGQTEEYRVAAETSAKQDWRNMIILRAILGIVFALDAFAIWKVARTEDDHGDQSPVSVSRPVAKLLLGTLKYSGSYILGILAVVLLTGSAENLNGYDEAVSLVFGSIPGFYHFFAVLVSEFPGLVIHAWWAVLILLVPFGCEAFVWFHRQSAFRLRSWRPLWIGFPVGCLGTLGLCWLALTSPWIG